MTRRPTVLFALILSALAAAAVASPARAGDEGPVIVIPSRPGIPVIINGVDASYAVVEGDWGLARPGFMAVTVIGGTPLAPSGVYSPHSPYHPRYGRAPPRGRNEVEPPPDRALPEPAESYSHFWSTSSDLQPVRAAPPPRALSINPPINPPGVDPVPPTITDPQTYPRNFIAPDVVAPRRRRH